MATKQNAAITARYNALRKANSLVKVNPTPAPGNAPGVMVTTYTAARWPGLTHGGTGIVVGQLLNAYGHIVALRVMHNGITYTMPAGCSSAMGSLFVPNAIVNRFNLMG